MLSFMARLNQDEFELTMDDDIKLASDESDGPCLDFWPYVDGLDYEAVDGVADQFSVDYFFKNSVRGLEHVMIRTDLPHTYLTVVIDTNEQKIVGHHVFEANPNLPVHILQFYPELDF
ncbi:hypothetical protein SH580_13165 [Coraliomargarita algicola]|uniref:Uncharacterized protein n=1 Tax=Coraliomargarita algicola TaxID=3092156 RepID=A0ABZ0RFU4_9BACT|nr:hypothetical protein [Coraliomargarita sp. J2-16]WPJ94383.1 hypothetical protein SH580_13165 [Coraliomargarita sp. J2-16]